jgi:hypothetical protein
MTKLLLESLGGEESHLKRQQILETDHDFDFLSSFNLYNQENYVVLVL